MRWNLKYAIKSYITASMWLIPLAAILFYMVFQRITYAIGAWLLRTGRLDEETAFLGLPMEGARTMLETVITLNLSFLVFTFGSLLVAIQVAGGQYTPRIIATTLLRDNVIRFTVGCFVFTMVFALRVVTRLDETVHQFNTFIAAMCGMFSIMAFLYLIDYAARFLRPVSIVAKVGQFGVAVIQSVYPELTTRPRPVPSAGRLGSPDRIVVNVGTPGVVLAVDLAGLVTQARQANGIIEFVPQVGDFLAVDEPLFRLYGGAGTIDDRRLREAVVARHRAHDGTGSDLRLSHPGRHRDQGAVGGHQRSDDGRDGHRPAAPSAAAGRAAGPARRGTSRRGRRTAACLPHAELGGLRAPCLHRNPALRRGQHPDHAADALDAGKPHADPAAASSCRVAPAARASGSHGRGRITRFPRTARWRTSPIRRGWAGRWACSP